MEPKVSERTTHLMLRAIEVAGAEEADLIASLVGSAFIDGAANAFAGIEEVIKKDRNDERPHWPSNPPRSA
jgi:hypothetical protein